MTSYEPAAIPEWQLRTLIFACAFAVALSLAIRGDSCGHDFDFHLQSWLGVAQQWRQGVLYPHWIEAANYGAGEPRLVFYPPLSWVLGALLGAVLSFVTNSTIAWQIAPIAFTLILLAASGFTMRTLANRWLPANASTLAACAYILTPYTLFVTYERTAYGELAASIWLPLLVLYSVRPGKQRHPERSAIGAQPKDLRFRQITPEGTDPGASRSASERWEDGGNDLISLSLVIAAIWLTNAPAAVMACYTLAAIALWRSIAQKRYQILLQSAAGLILGLGLAAFYLVPAAYERRWVDIARAIAPGMRIEDSFLFGHTGEAFHDQVLRAASWIFATMAAAIVAAGAIAWKRPASPAYAEIYLRNSSSVIGPAIPLEPLNLEAPSRIGISPVPLALVASSQHPFRPRNRVRNPSGKRPAGNGRRKELSSPDRNHASRRHRYRLHRHPPLLAALR